MATTAGKTKRLDLRLSDEHKELIEEAATLRGQAVSSFVLTTAIERAQEILRREETTTLSTRDRAAFFRILDHTEPLPTLTQAARRFRARYG